MKRLALLTLFAVGACGSSDPGPVLTSAFTASWSIDDEQGFPITACGDVPADTVTFDFDGRTSGDLVSFVYTCDQGLDTIVTSQSDLLRGEVYDADVTLWFDYQGPNQQIVGTQPFVVTPNSPVFSFPTILFALQ